MALLFSYGTLQLEPVQLSTFGRWLHGEPDELVGFEQSVLKIEDPEFVAASGKSHHAIVKYNGRHDSRVRGTVFEVADAELAKADGYEPAGYTRISATLASGRQAWGVREAPRPRTIRVDPRPSIKKGSAARSRSVPGCCRRAGWL